MDTATIVGLARAGSSVLAQEDTQLFLGDDFFAWMILAFGAAMVMGNLLAMIRPPGDRQGDDASPPAKPPVGRSLVLIAVGLGAALWGLASLLGD